MADPARRRATYEDVLSAPPNKVAELIECGYRLDLVVGAGILVELKAIERLCRSMRRRS